MTDAVLAINAGSSSLKFSVFEADRGAAPLLRGQIASLHGEPAFSAFDGNGRPTAHKTWCSGESLSHASAADYILAWLDAAGLGGRRLVAAGHRVVHGGVRFARPVRIDAAVISELESLVPLAPLHQPQSLAVIGALTARSPRLPQVACFDTAFHRTQPMVAQVYGLPRRFTDRGVRRYGFHGLSYEYIAERLPSLDAEISARRVIVAHLGNGASLCALHAGRSVATTMGFTAMDGLVMGTRCGSIDPGVLIFLQQHLGLSVDDMQRLLYEESGLLGVSGISGDMRILLQSQDRHAREAVDLFVYRVVREIGSLAAAMGGLDGLVFTGGIGENAAPVRKAVCEGCAWLGLETDDTSPAVPTRRISTNGSRIAVWVIPTNEELMIARHIMDVLGLRSP